MTSTKVITCTCEHEYQDAKYGPKKRVHNYAMKGYRGAPGWRCTVCTATKGLNE